MKAAILSLIALIPCLSFACPELTGVYDCKSQDFFGLVVGLDLKAQKLEIQSTEKDYKMTWSLHGTRLIRETGRFETGPFTASDKLTLGQTTTVLDPVTTMVTTVSCEGGTVSKFVNYDILSGTITLETYTQHGDRSVTYEFARSFPVNCTLIQ